jgi:hypothetical protein
MARAARTDGDHLPQRQITFYKAATGRGRSVSSDERGGHFGVEDGWHHDFVGAGESGKAEARGRVGWLSAPNGRNRN